MFPNFDLGSQPLRAKMADPAIRLTESGFEVLQRPQNLVHTRHIQVWIAKRCGKSMQTLLGRPHNRASCQPASVAKRDIPSIRNGPFLPLGMPGKRV